MSIQPAAVAMDTEQEQLQQQQPSAAHASKSPKARRGSAHKRTALASKHAAAPSIGSETSSGMDDGEALDETDELGAGSEEAAASPADSPLIPACFPRALFTEGYSYGLRVLSDRLTVQYVQKAMHLLDVGTVRSALPIPKPRESRGLYYFELTVLDTGERNQITIGLAPLHSACLFAPANMHSAATPVPPQASLRQHDTASLTCRQVGMDSLSYGFRGDKGEKFHGNIAAGPQGRPSPGGQAYSQPFGAGDTVGCGLNYFDGSVFFTKNGRNLGTAFTIQPKEWAAKLDPKEQRDPAVSPIDERMDFFAAVSLHSKGESVRLNFGAQPFAFDVEAYRAGEAAKVRRSISSIPAMDSSVMLAMVRSWLLNQGYEKSVEALNQMTSGQTVVSAAASSSSSSSAAASSMQDDSKAPSSSSSASLPSRHDQIAERTLQPRRVIRDLIEAGEIEKAMAALHQLAPTLWSNPAQRTVSSPLTAQQLQLRLLSLQFIGLLTSASPTRVMDAIEFSQRMLLPFQSSADPHLRSSVEQLMGLLAYPDVHSSPLSHLLSESYRGQTADYVNAAVLSSLCAPTSAASSVHGVSSLELLVRHALAVEGVLQSKAYPIALPSVMDKQE